MKALPKGERLGTGRGYLRFTPFIHILVERSTFDVDFHLIILYLTWIGFGLPCPGAGAKFGIRPKSAGMRTKQIITGPTVERMQREGSGLKYEVKVNMS